MFLPVLSVSLSNTWSVSIGVDSKDTASAGVDMCIHVVWKPLLVQKGRCAGNQTQECTRRIADGDLSVPRVKLNRPRRAGDDLNRGSSAREPEGGGCVTDTLGTARALSKHVRRLIQSSCRPSVQSLQSQYILSSRREILTIPVAIAPERLGLLKGGQFHRCELAMRKLRPAFGALLLCDETPTFNGPTWVVRRTGAR